MPKINKQIKPKCEKQAKNKGPSEQKNFIIYDIEANWFSM